MHRSRPSTQTGTPRSRSTGSTPRATRSPASFNALLAEQAARRGDQTFVFDSTTSLTYASFRDKVLRVAVGLKRQGVRRGDRVAVQLPNWADFAVISAALSRVGAIMVPIMPIYRSDDVGYALRDAGVRTAITSGRSEALITSSMYEDLRASCPGPARPDRGRGDGRARVRSGWTISFRSGHRARRTGPASGPDDPFVIVYTLGHDRTAEGVPAHLQYLRVRVAHAGPGVRLFRA